MRGQAVSCFAAFLRRDALHVGRVVTYCACSTLTCFAVVAICMGWSSISRVNIYIYIYGMRHEAHYYKTANEPK